MRFLLFLIAYRSPSTNTGSCHHITPKKCPTPQKTLCPLLRHNLSVTYLACSCKGTRSQTRPCLVQTALQTLLRSGRRCAGLETVRSTEDMGLDKTWVIYLVVSNVGDDGTECVKRTQ
jgi:hypothetical protein